MSIYVDILKCLDIDNYGLDKYLKYMRVIFFVLRWNFMCNNKIVSVTRNCSPQNNRTLMVQIFSFLISCWCSFEWALYSAMIDCGSWNQVTMPLLS